MRKIIIPPIKSQGIKTKLVPWINALVPLCNGRWIEPFAGTGVVAFNMGFKKNILSDINPHIIRFYRELQSGKINGKTVRDYLEKEGVELFNSGENGYVHYRKIRDRFNKYFEPLDFLFLSRAGFNGMIRFNGKGFWNIPFCKKPERFSKSYITKIVNQVNAVKKIIDNDWTFESKDFREVIGMARPSDIVYCDPPYHGRYVDYYNGWTDTDELDLHKCLLKTKARFILSTWHHNSYRKNEMINTYWNDFNIITKDHYYHSGGKVENRNSIVEALVFNFDTCIKKHNYEIIPDNQQMLLFEKRERYLASKLHINNFKI